LILVENSEFNLYQIENWIRTYKPEIIPKLTCCYADIRDRKKLSEVFSRYKPTIVYHAAALKHVPLMEQNKVECVKTNVLGTKNVVDMAVSNNVELFTLISTDKAVCPENTMGFTKRVAEVYCQTVSQAQKTTNFNIVRFGNVLGSSGSVIPLFTEQINAGGPVTVTHEEATRFFMTIPEAAQLVLQTGSIKKRKITDIFVLEMGAPVRIVKLAEKMIRLSGLRPYKDIAIKYIGLRPGEKLHEELYLQASSMDSTTTDGILVTDGLGSDQQDMLLYLKTLFDEVEERPVDLILSELARFVPEHRIKGFPLLANENEIRNSLH